MVALEGDPCFPSVLIIPSVATTAGLSGAEGQIVYDKNGTQVKTWYSSQWNNM